MASRKRNPHESFQAYRERLKVEAQVLKDRRQGRLVWLSKALDWGKGMGRTFRREAG